ncbi:hypothetical protein O0L34_g6616 [Tuta absoluta]|nr:hypothetical protein O0L34_g6616 [Tuta absoluta]
MTLAERRNAAMFLLHTTARPFTFMGSSFRCFYCLKYQPDVNQLLQHTATHVVDDFEVILQKHVPKGKRTLHADVSDLRCRQCNESFVDLASVRTHLAKSHCVEFCKENNGLTEFKLETERFQCHLCNDEFHNFSFLNKHMNSHINKVVCETCGAGFLNQHLLLRHKETHLTKKYYCKNCEQVFFKRSQLKYHTSKIHIQKDKAKPNKCPYCPETFKEHYSKVLHMKRTHGISKTFPCHLCKSRFETRRSLTEHINKFHTERFKCGTCLKCFSIESKLQTHMRSHSGERRYVCPICKNAYMHTVTLRKHMRSHTEQGILTT